MNQTQQKYARTRLEKIRNEKVRELTEKFTSKEIVLTLEDRIDAIKSGRFSIKTTSRDPWEDKNSLRKIQFTDEKSSVFDKVGHDAAKARLEAEYTRIMDDLILGDAEDALKGIKSFIEFKI